MRLARGFPRKVARLGLYYDFTRSALRLFGTRQVGFPTNIILGIPREIPVEILESYEILGLPS